MSAARNQKRIKETIAKTLYDLTVEYVFQRSQPINKSRKDQLFKEYNEKWITFCFKQRSNKSMLANAKAFENIIGSVKKVIQYQRMLGLPEERLTLLQRILG